jgi:arylsulfatase A-like enzyme
MGRRFRQAGYHTAYCGKTHLAFDLEPGWEPGLRRTKTEGGLEKQYVNLCGKQKITKTTHAVLGQETKWEIPV